VEAECARRTDEWPRDTERKERYYTRVRRGHKEESQVDLSKQRAAVVPRRVMSALDALAARRGWQGTSRRPPPILDAHTRPSSRSTSRSSKECNRIVKSELSAVSVTRLDVTAVRSIACGRVRWTIGARMRGKGTAPIGATVAGASLLDSPSATASLIDSALQHESAPHLRRRVTAARGVYRHAHSHTHAMGGGETAVPLHTQFAIQPC
jgi:hypothetical protein